MVDPVSAVCLAALTEAGKEFTIGTVVGGIIGNRADRIFAKVMGRTVDQFVKNIRLPENHDLLKGLLASHQVALAYAAETMSGQSRNPLDRIIANKIIAIASRPLPDKAGHFDALQAMVTPLLAGETEGSADARRANLIEGATSALVTWLEAESQETLPAHFRAVLKDDAPNGRHSWLSVFRLYISEEIKKPNSRYGQIFLAENVSEIVGRTITIQALAEDLGRGMDALRGELGLVAEDVKLVLVQQQNHGDQLAELLTLARQGGVFQQAAQQGISETAVRKIVEQLGGQGVAKEDLLTWLEGWIESAKDALGRHSNEGEAFEAARAEAERRFRAGQSATAADPFMQLLEREQAETKLRQITIIEEAIRFDMLALNAAGVVTKTRLLAVSHGATDARAKGDFFSARANASYQLGFARGDNLALLIATENYRLALEERTRERVPLDWAATQNNLAIVLWRLGERESGTARLEQAVAAHRLALEERTRERVPLDWAATQNNLANALCSLGKRETGTARLEEAVVAFRLALEERTRERVPLDWAATQNNLANALWSLGERETGTARLEEAVVAFRLALEELTRERVPLDWAATQRNVASVLWRLGERESGTARLEEAVVACRLALEELTRERVPLEWARTQMAVANTLWRLGERETGTVRLEEAIAAYGFALQELTRERVPLEWARTQLNLAGVLSSLGERETGTARLEEGVAACRLALEELTREQVPLDWAFTQNNLASFLLSLGQRESGTARLQEAVAAYRLALEERTRERVPLEWARTQVNLASALLRLGERESETARLEEAVAAYRLALEELTRQRVPLDWATTQMNLANALFALGERETGTARLEEAVATFGLALEEWTRERVPLDWALACIGLAESMTYLADRNADLALLAKSASLLREARSVAKVGLHEMLVVEADRLLALVTEVHGRLEGR